MLFPLASFEAIDPKTSGKFLDSWGHWLGPLNRPFGSQHFGLFVRDELVSVAALASTVNKICGGYERLSVVELAPGEWAAKYWPVSAVVSYSNALRHGGDVYRFDGWKKVQDVRGGRAGGNWSRGKEYDPKSVWVYEVAT